MSAITRMTAGLMSWVQWLSLKILSIRGQQLQLGLPTLGEIYQQELQLRQLALQEAVLSRPTRPFYREDDHQIIAEYEELAAADPLNFNTEQMYEDLIAERQLAELLEAQAGMNEWWLIALPEERQAWLEKARRLQQRQKGSPI